MSFILKALKKVEKEKSARRKGEVPISEAILSPDRPSLLSAHNYHKIWIISLLLFVVACMGMFILLKAPSHVVQQKQKGDGPVSPRPNAPPPNREFFGEEKSPSPATTVITDEVPVQDRTATPATAAASVKGDNLRPVALVKSTKSPKRKISIAGNSPTNELTLVAPPTSLIVNGIALQDDPGESIAVVNGQIVKRGMTVEGAQVKRIFLDRVRFSGNGGEFEVHLAK
ncbi:MAG TPA: hypothetical protein VMC44_00355 [Geobacteraceae bacterium]|nr:hypothetical protein [Geobacteraceae bacterium]